MILSYRELGDPKVLAFLQDCKNDTKNESQLQSPASQPVALNHTNFVQRSQPDSRTYTSNPAHIPVFEQQIHHHPVSKKSVTTSAPVVHPSTSVSTSPLPSMRSTGFAGPPRLTVHRLPNYRLRHSATRSHGSPSTGTDSRVGNRIRTIEHLSRMPPPAITTIDAIESRFLGGRKRCQRDDDEEAEAMVKRVRKITIADDKNEPITTNQISDANEPQSKGWKSWISGALHWFSVG